MEELNNQSNNNMLNPENPSPENDLEKAHKKTKRYHGRYFIVMVLSLIIIEYYLYTFQVILPNLNDNNFINITLILFFFNIIIFMMLLAYFITMNTHPGQIPLYWGFYIGDDQYKRKRYCLICNAFKPERSHHCSVCNTCVLNMDHHCPWVDNCIGFYNRKFFMQLLIYTSILTIYMDFSELYWIFFIVKDVINMKILYKDFIHVGIILICYVFIFVFSIIITMFLKFHIELVLKNSTTIESLDKEHAEENAKFNVDKGTNWEQVFGKNKILWFIPIFSESSRPVGDGLSWPEKKNNNSNNIESGVLPNTSNQEGPNVMRNSNRGEEENKINNNNNYGSNYNNYNYASSSQPITSNKIKNESDN